MTRFWTSGSAPPPPGSIKNCVLRAAVEDLVDADQVMALCLTKLYRAAATKLNPPQVSLLYRTFFSLLCVHATHNVFAQDGDYSVEEAELCRVCHRS